jgi:hypothetical protein
MIFQKGSYTHDMDSVALRAEYFAIFDTMKRRIGTKIRFTIIGVLRGASQSEVSSKISGLMDAYRTDYDNVILFTNDGGATPHAIYNVDTWGGTKVAAGPSFINGPWSGQPEYANQRTYFVVIEAETRSTDAGNYAWKERLLIKGTGAPKWVYSPQQVGDPQYQILQTSTSFWYIQEGTAVSQGQDYIDPPNPLFPGIEHGDMREISFETGDDLAYDSTAGVVLARQNKSSWKYFMEATVSQGFTPFIIPE